MRIGGTARNLIRMRKWGVAAGMAAVAALATFASVAHASRREPARGKGEAAHVATGLSSPIALAWRAKDTAHMYVALQGGDVIVMTKGKQIATALHLTGLAVGGEQGLLGIAFSNDGKKLYVDYTDSTGDIHIVEYTMRGDVANVATRRELLVIPHHIFPNHNGGNLVIGPDNMLYIGVGDGGGGGDSLMNGQNTDVLLGKILRIDPTPSATLAVHDSARQPVLRTNRQARRDLDVRAAQSVALLVRPPDRRHVDRRRRPGSLRRDRLRAQGS